MDEPELPEPVLTVEESWPVSTIDGEPSIARGSMDVYRRPDGSYFLSTSVGPPGGAPEEHEYGEFVLSAENAAALGAALSGR